MWQLDNGQRVTPLSLIQKIILEDEGKWFILLQVTVTYSKVANHLFLRQ